MIFHDFFVEHVIAGGKTNWCLTLRMGHQTFAGFLTATLRYQAIIGICEPNSLTYAY